MISLKSNEIPEFHERRIYLHSLRAGSVHNEAQISPECAVALGRTPSMFRQVVPPRIAQTHTMFPQRGMKMLLHLHGTVTINRISEAA